MLRRTLLFIALGALLVASPLLAAEDPAAKSASDLLPASTVAYVEIRAPGKLIDTIVDHPLSKKLASQPEYQKALDTPDMERLREAVRAFEEKLGTKWRPALTTLTHDGIYFGVELGTQGVVLLVRSSDPGLLVKTRDTLIELARQQAADNGEGDPIATEEYREITSYRANQVYVATLGPWLIVTNKARVGQMVIDNALDGGLQTLARERQFQEAVKHRHGEPTIWAYLDLTILRVSGIAKSALNKKSDNPALELLAGGILSAVPEAPFITASVDVSPERVAFSTGIPFDPSKIGARRAYYFGPDGNGSAPAVLEPKGTMLSISTYRDFHLLWKNAPELFTDGVNAEFDKAESGLGTLFSGRSFSDDILGNLQPGMQLVVTRQTFDKAEVVPQIKLPALGMVFRMKNPEETARQFKVTFQSLIGFANVAGSQAETALEPLEQDTEKIGNITLVSSRYVPPKDEAQRRDARIHFNASPTIALVGDQFVFASTRQLALELAQAVENPPKAQAGVNTQVRFSGQVLRDVLTDNRETLIAQNQLDKGHDRAAAEQEIGLLLRLLEGFRETTLTLATGENQLRLTWELKLAASE